MTSKETLIEEVAPSQRWRFSHWTSHFIISRLRVALYQRFNPDAPWLTRGAIEFLSSWLRPEDVGLEWGSGRSTFWFASRVKELTSIEHDLRWYQKVSRALRGTQNVDYIYGDVTDVENAMERYAAAAPRLHERTLDFVLVDGLYRAECMSRAVNLLKPSGLLILDNANWYLPHPSRSPDSVGNRVLRAEWRSVHEAIRSWRCYWTTNGVWDTALFFAPHTTPENR